MLKRQVPNLASFTLGTIRVNETALKLKASKYRKELSKPQSVNAYG